MSRISMQSNADILTARRHLSIHESLSCILVERCFLISNMEEYRPAIVGEECWTGWGVEDSRATWGRMMLDAWIPDVDFCALIFYFPCHNRSSNDSATYWAYSTPNGKTNVVQYCLWALWLEPQPRRGKLQPPPIHPSVEAQISLWSDLVPPPPSQPLPLDLPNFNRGPALLSSCKFFPNLGCCDAIMHQF